jgi:hypothetical protein
MPNTRQNIPRNDCVLSALRACVEVSCEPPGVHVHHLLVLLIHGHVGGRMTIASPTESLHLAEDTIPQIGVSSMGRPTMISYSVTVVSPHERWNVCVSGRHRSKSVVNVADSINGRPRVVTS